MRLHHFGLQVAGALLVALVVTGCSQPSTPPPAPSVTIPPADLNTALDAALDQLESDGKITAEEKTRIKDRVTLGNGKHLDEDGKATAAAFTLPNEDIIYVDGDVIGAFASPGHPLFPLILKIFLMHEIFHLHRNTTTGNNPCPDCTGPSGGGGVRDEGETKGREKIPTCDHIGLQYWTSQLFCDAAKVPGLPQAQIDILCAMSKATRYVLMRGASKIKAIECEANGDNGGGIGPPNWGWDGPIGFCECP